MNFLQIAEQVRKLSGIQGEILSVNNAKGVYETLLDIINSEYNIIQTLRESWSWMISSGGISLTPYVNSYSNSGVRKYTSIKYNNTPLRFVEYDSWISPSIPYSVPQYFTIVPETNELVFNLVSDNCVVNFRGIRTIDRLTSNTQIPVIPESFHYTLIYKAAASMSAVLGNADLVNQNILNYDVMVGQLMRETNIPKKIKITPIV